jgi:two-component system phosphate regulon sensor histidine kinase PhoR
MTRNVGQAIEISIRDHGIGMKAEDARRAFEKYFRVSTGDRHDVKGFGLGLSYVKLMTEVHEGTVNIDSSPGKGTTVTLTFPLDSRGDAGTGRVNS